MATVTKRCDVCNSEHHRNDDFAGSKLLEALKPRWGGVLLAKV
jgi:hypothetical protein